MSLYNDLNSVLTPYANKIKQNEANVRLALSLEGGGAPTVVSSISAMTNTNQIYVLTTDGNWYYYDGSDWVSGGEYGTVVTDKTLTLEDSPADAKVVGTEISAVKTSLTDLGEQVNGVGGGSKEYTVPFNITWEDDEYVTYTTGKLGNRQGSSVSNIISIPSNAEKITIKGSALTVSGGYAFYYGDNRSYYVSGATLRDGTNIVTVEIDEIPDGATHFSFTTISDNKSLSGAWYTYVETEPKSEGLVDDVKTLQDKSQSVDEILSSCIDKSDAIEWTIGYRIIRTYGQNVSSAYKIGMFNAERGDKIIIDHSEEIPKGTVQLSEVVTIGDGTEYRPLVPEIPAKHIEYIVPQDMEVCISVKTASLTNLKWYRMPVNNGAIDTEDSQDVIFPWGKVTQILSASRKNPMNKGNRMQKPLVLAHISDIHNNRINSKAFKDFVAKFGGYLDDAIITGDMAGSKYPDYHPIWEQTGYNKVLLTIGNHDVYDYAGTHESSDYYDREYFATEKQTYDQYFAPSISNWNVVQPSNAVANGYCYYYKDYSLTSNADSTTVSAIRLIVLDPMHYNSAQHTWLETTLTSAKASGYPVVIAEHFIPMETTDDMNLFDTAFSSLMPGMRDVYGLYFLSYVDGNVRYKAADVVDDFISGGGEFICWICGHMHFDLVGTLKSHPNQIFVAVGTASAYPDNAYSDMPREYGMESENLINIISFDTYNKMIRVGRIGAKIDDHMRHRGSMCINYVSKNLVYSW